MNNVEPVVRRAGAHALLVELADPAADPAADAATDAAADPAAWHAELCRRREAGELTAVDIVPAARTVLLDGGPDLPTVAAHWGVTESDVVRRLRSTELRVAFCGFAPGFAYLTGLPPECAVPRLATPRPRVPAGSVGLAARYAAIYPGASPGGWLLVGRTEVRLFDVDADPPALLTPGTRVRLT